MWNITVDDEFKGSDKIYDPLGSDLYKGSAVTLTEDYSAFTPSGVVIPMKAVSSLDLNGYTFKNENGTALDVRGSLTINGSGQVLCDGPVGEAYAAVFVQDGGKVVINDGYYYSNNGNSCIYVQAGDKTGHTITIGGEAKPLYYGGGIVEINGGVFEAQANKFVLNQNDYIENESCFSVKGGIFVGFNPAEVNECHGKVTSFVADGYKAVETTYEGKQAWKVEAIPAVTTQEAFNSAIATANSTVVLAEGTYTMPATVADGVSIIGADASTSVLTLNSAVAWHGKTVVVKNLTVITNNADYNGIQHAKSLKFENCSIKGKIFSYADEAVFNNCKFVQDVVDYNIWTYGSKEITFNNCVFDCQGKAVLIYNEKNQTPTTEHPEITEPLKINFNKCTFTAHAKATSSEGKTYGAIEIDSSISTPFNITITDCTSTGFSYDSAIYHVKKHKYNVSIVIDGNSVYNE